jgi:hypothetical protein
VQEALRVPKPGTDSRFWVLLLAVDMLKPDDRDWPLPWMNWVMTGSARPDPQWLIERLTGS